MPSGYVPDAGLHSGVDGQRRLPRLLRTARITRAGALAAAAAVVVTAPRPGGLAVFAGLPAEVLAAVRSVGLAALVLLAVLAGLSRRGLRALPGPLRYGCSVDAFLPAPGSAAPAATATLHHDLARLLATRHPRLDMGGHGTADAGSAHSVAVGGVCLARTEPGSETRVVEVQPSVLVGAASPTGAPADRVSVTGAATPAVVAMAGDDLSPDEYATLLDRVRASVSEELYRQLAEHVADQVAFLPTRYLRGRALCHEAEDHARSGTSRAHARARRLFDLAAHRLDPGPRPLPPTAVRRAGALVAVAASRASAFGRRAGARVWPRLADRDVLWARCQLGSAALLLDRRVLSGLPGRELTPIYEAQPLVRSALARLSSLPAGVAGREAGLFDGSVLLALTLAHLGDRPTARRHLEEARAADPSRAEHDPTFLLAAAELDERPASRIRRLRRAAALHPVGGTAQWRVAQELERAWRSGADLDPTVAASVLAAYRKVLTLDPGHLGAWASVGYVRWLLGDLPGAQATFASGWQARALGAGTFRTEFDLGRARAAAETGRLDEAYRHARDATAGLVAEGVPQLPDGEPGSFGAWCYARSPGVVDRCRRYRRQVTEHLEAARGTGRWSPAVLDRVDGFVWYDLGECLRYTGRLEEAEQAFVRATTADPGCVPALLQLTDLCRRRGDEEGAARVATDLSRWEPSWETGALAGALNHARRAAAARRRAAQAGRAAVAHDAERAAVERRRLVTGAAQATAEPPGAEVMSVLTAVRRAGPGGSADTPTPAPADTSPNGGAAPPRSRDAAETATPRAPGAVLAAQLERLDAEIDERRRQSERHAARARRAGSALRRTVPSVVPHGWLWRGPGDDGLDWLALNPPDPRQEHRWERQLAEHHAVALFLYGHAWLRHPPDGVREELAYQRAAALLRCVRERFLPRNRAVVVDLLVAEAAVGAPDRVADLVADVAADTDEKAREVLAGVLAADDGTHPDWQADILAAAGEQERFSPALSAWIADQARTTVLPNVDTDRGRRLSAAARTALRRGLRARRQGDLLLVGDGLGELCDAEHAAQAYRAALDAGADAGADNGPDSGATVELAHRAALRLAAVEFLAGRWTPADGAAPPGHGGPAFPRAEIAEAIGEELARARNRPCPDDGALDAAAEHARLWVAAERETAARTGDADAWRDAEAARLALAAALPPPSVRVRDGDAVEAPRPATGRIAVEASPAHGPVAAAGLEAFRAAAEDARRQVGDRFGLRVPEIGWRDGVEELAADSYRFVVDGVPVATGRLSRGAGSLGRHLAACLEDRLASFLGVQEVCDALAEAAAAEGAGKAERESAAAVLRSGPALRSLTVCLQALLQERVPIDDLGTLVDAHRRARPEEASVRQLVARLRRSVRDRLPGNASGWRRLRLPDALEDDIRRHAADGELRTSSPEVLEALLAAVRAAVREAGPAPLAVVTDPSLRLPVRRLVALEDPSVPVLADDEVVTVIRLPDDEPAPSPRTARTERTEGTEGTERSEVEWPR